MSDNEESPPPLIINDSDNLPSLTVLSSDSEPSSSPSSSDPPSSYLFDEEDSENCLLPKFFEENGFFDNEVNEYNDYSLLAEELEEFLAPPDCGLWEDHLSTDNPTFITMDEAKSKQWYLAKKEITHVRKKIKEMIGKDDVSKEDIFLYTLGPNSGVGMYLKKELDISDEKYIAFMSIFCIQCAYRMTSTELFHPFSLLKKEVPEVMSEKDYNNIWRVISTKKKISSVMISTNRREEPMWSEVEQIVNHLLRKISIFGRSGEISVALDDDKIWLSQTQSKTGDLFGLKYTTHNKANRKGLVAHTAVSTGANIPLGIMFERTFDSTNSCFKRLFNFLFSHDSDGKDDNAFRNVTVHSDRGYLIPSLVFEFLLTNGAHVVGTVKRMAGCWPFTFDQKIKDTDTRTKIDCKGAPALFLKSCKGQGTTRERASTRKLFSSAFRNGSDKVATAISSLHPHHQWEGVIYEQRELAKYKMDRTSLRSIFFQHVDTLFDEVEEDEEEKIIMKTLLDEFFCPMTLRQGK